MKADAEMLCKGPRLTIGALSTANVSSNGRINHRNPNLFIGVLGGL